jgi:hypothetical protein
MRSIQEFEFKDFLKKDEARHGDRSGLDPHWSMLKYWRRSDSLAQ